jgi:uncharacterized membrane protein YkoI
MGSPDRITLNRRVEMTSVKKSSFVLFVLSVCLLCLGTGFAQQTTKKAQPKKESAKAETGENKIQMKDLPAAVQKTAQEQSKGATIVGISSEKEGGKTIYELETKVNGRSRDMLIDATGKVTELEEQADVEALPPAVQAEVKKSLGQGKVDTFESVTKNGVFSGYEAVVERGGKKVEVSMGTDGKVPPPPAKK